MSLSDILFIFSLLVLDIVGVLFSLFYAFNIVSMFFGAPYVKSKKKARMEMLKIAKIDREDILFELGSGDGTLLLEAAKLYEFKRAYGIEINPLFFIISKIRVLFSSSKDKVEIRYGNFLNQDLTKSNVIFTYLFPGVQLKLVEKFKRELRPGTRIISNDFTFPGLSLRQKVFYSQTGKFKEYIREYIIE